MASARVQLKGNADGLARTVKAIFKVIKLITNYFLLKHLLEQLREVLCVVHRQIVYDEDHAPNGGHLPLGHDAPVEDNAVPALEAAHRTTVAVQVGATGAATCCSWNQVVRDEACDKGKKCFRKTESSRNFTYA